MTVVVITPPGPVINVQAARARLNLDVSIDDNLLATMIAAAQAMVDGPAGTLGRCVMSQTLEWRSLNWARRHNHDWNVDPFRPGIDGWSRHWGHHQSIELPFPPVAGVSSVTYLDETGTRQTLSSSAYETTVDGDVCHVAPIFGTLWPVAAFAADSVRIQYTAGYDTPPPGIVQAILMQARALTTLSTRDGFLRSETVQGVGSQSFDTSASSGVIGNAAIEALLAPYRIPSL